MSTSQPSTPPATGPIQRADFRFRDLRGQSEWVEGYRPGGYHPVHFGDVFHDRYKVVRKLGYGAYSTVWLAKDQFKSRYVAVKVKTSRSSTADNELRVLKQLQQSVSQNAGKIYITTLLDDFQLEGPNGTHNCLVFSTLGVSLSPMLDELREGLLDPEIGNRTFSTRIIKRLSRQILEGLDFLHRQSVIHGDLQPGNILFSLSQDVLAESLQEGDDDAENGSGGKELVERLDGKTDRWAPRYISIPEPLTELIDLSGEFEIAITDFGGAFLKAEKESALAVTPVALRAPEIIVDSPLDTGIDIWSFGCLLFELVTGEQLFAVAHVGTASLEGCNDDHLLQMSDLLGPLPPSILKEWSRSGKYIRPDGTLYNTMVDGPEAINTFGPLEALMASLPLSDMSEPEKAQFALLLRRILKYEPAQRPSAAEVLRDPWFR